MGTGGWGLLEGGEIENGLEALLIVTTASTKRTDSGI
jgi:hypothetical protein